MERIRTIKRHNILFSAMFIIIYLALLLCSILLQIHASNSVKVSSEFLFYVLTIGAGIAQISSTGVIIYLMIFVCREINNSKTSLYKGKSLLTNDIVYGELYCDCEFDEQSEEFITKNNYYIREYYLDDAGNIKYVDHKVIGVSSI